MSESAWPADRFEANRTHLRAVACRMLGSRKSRRNEPLGTHVPFSSHDRCS